MLRTVLIDDEPIIVEELAMLLQEDERIELVGTYTDPLQLLLELPALKPDCIFLDIEMPALSGIELAEKLSAGVEDYEIVFVTAYNHYAAQAFDVNAIDYILKPVRAERIRKAVDKLIAKVNLKPKPTFGAGNCSIRCFGAFEVTVGQKPIKWTRSKSKELLAYLLQHEGRWLSKYKLCDEQWADYEPERALAYLQTSLYALRKNLKAAGCTQLQIEYANDRYILRADEVEWDVRRFEAAYAEFMRTGLPSAARVALECCGGEYYEGEDWLWSDLVREDYIRRCEKLARLIDA